MNQCPARRERAVWSWGTGGWAAAGMVSALLHVTTRTWGPRRPELSALTDPQLSFPGSSDGKASAAEDLK